MLPACVATRRDLLRLVRPGSIGTSTFDLQSIGARTSMSDPDVKGQVEWPCQTLDLIDWEG